MTDRAFLTYLADPFGVGGAVFWLTRPDAPGGPVSAAEIEAFRGQMLTLELSTLLDELRRQGLNAPNAPVDIGEAIRLAAGLPKDDGGERRWDIWRNLARHFDERASARRFERTFKSRDARPEQETLWEILSEASAALQRLWLETEDRLAAAGETARFWTVEAPVQAIFAHRQVAGLAVNRTAASGLLEAAADEKYSAYLSVAERLESSPTGINFWNLGPRLARTDLADLSDVIDGGRLRGAFKLAAHRSAFAQEFLALVEAGQDEVILRRAAGVEPRVFPTFALMGTVSGRVLVSDPYLQQLRRRYRAIIAPDEAKRLVYLDYAQFEPGILAYLSGDPALRAAYRAGDLYKALSVQVFGDESHRPLAKRMFLAFCYGMPAEGIAKLVTSDNSDRQDRQAAVEAFFAAFPGLQTYRQRMVAEIMEKDQVASLFGNHRLRSRAGELSRKEERWAANHPVQATAALIFKEALIGLADAFGKDAILLPVHDAALLQFDDDAAFDDRVEQACAIMLQAFERRCPDIGPKVTAGAFSD
jgi:hypothetical protein